MQGSLGTADNGEVRDIIDKEMEHNLKREKQRNMELRELINANRADYDAALKQLNFLQQQKEVTCVTWRGNQVSLGRIAMTIDELLRYRESVLRSCQDLQAELQTQHLQQDPLERELRTLEAEVQRIALERESLREQIHSSQRKFDDLCYRNGSKARDECTYFRRTKSRFSGKVLSLALESVFRSHLQQHFSSLRSQQRNDYRQISSILAFRKLCYRYSDNRLRKFFFIWYLNALKPKLWLTANQKITDLMTKNERKKVLLIRWHHQQLMTNT